MEAPEFQEPNYTYRAKVVEIIDGDTIDVSIDVGFNTTLRKRLRFLGIDTYELRGDERDKGIVAKDRLRELLSKSDRIFVQTKMDATGKYGRVLAWVWVKPKYGGDPINITEQLLAEGHGVPYPA